MNISDYKKIILSVLMKRLSGMVPLIYTVILFIFCNTFIDWSLRAL